MVFLVTWRHWNLQHSNYKQLTKSEHLLSLQTFLSQIFAENIQANVSIILLAIFMQATSVFAKGAMIFCPFDHGLTEIVK